MDNEKKCEFGYCKNWIVCKQKVDKGVCDKFEPCMTYMDKYNNDKEHWEEMHNFEE